MIDNIQNVTQDQLRTFIERLERLEEEKKLLTENIKDIYGEAKATGFDVKAIKKILSLRKKDEKQWMEEEQILDVYLRALGMLKDE
ncbi:DUF2312 domain-containing protein [Candidatus Liberibacter asiaticus]|uniref:UPF0335 protein CLIBASIA_04910 n=2 Tax=Liberibacter asiaticus TaxID=34021 RepID=C6XGQ0_LIBAP|nr:GapR family DNA-binding domain-containing protein [Candidatus Liberibacter asiaticus]ACT57553.1 hypothetical protein CLIBASIA_04910 [Candidatus Liberibacter asiaticus str. psy62]AGH17316.1 hypothetical protein WSI_04740 [Candidatus Liberibacter asiaticus str. gxpsy]ALK07602.1 DUF2312 domain-containing protein [Candidatus Liberibacter asiaticus]ASK53092.1 DUF2312 domain-containing protein [Candidatus Liberibacter asiaticus]AWL14417.1 DUF2312 domain-containing protein [Candidatus Liberibacter